MQLLRTQRKRTLVALGQLVDPPDDCFEHVLVLGQAGRHLDETGRQDALRELRQSLEALDAARLARGRVHGAVLEAPFDAEQVDPRFRQRKADLYVLAGGLRGAPAAAVVAGDHHLGTTTNQHTHTHTHTHTRPLRSATPAEHGGID